MTTRDMLKQEIVRECQGREGFSRTELKGLIEEGAEQRALEDLLFFAPPNDFLAHTQNLRQHIEKAFDGAAAERQRRYLSFLTKLALALRSFLPRWNLQNQDRHGRAALDDASIQAEADRVQALVARLETQVPGVVEKMLGGWRAETMKRFEAEDAADSEDQVLALVGASIDEYLTHVGAALSTSQLRRIAEMRAAGQTRTELANDYAAFLQYAMYLGASFVTCNPPLVDAAWVAFPERWNPVMDEIITHHPGASDDDLARLMTLEVVLDNMRLLRPIFLLTTGRMGCVCFQVNPHNHDDPSAMVADAVSVYEALRSRFDGGVPNIVFKLPGTQGGLEACRVLTQRGIGVTITVNFGMFQHIPFAEAIRDGQSIYSNLVEMSGRLAYPVRDEMLRKLDELAEYAIDEARAREAAAWSGVAVVKRIHALLEQKGYDLGQVKPLVASLRIYEGDAYAGLPGAFPDMTEIVGTSILSVFPNVRRAFDAQAGVAVEPHQIESPVPDEVLETLTHSEIFKQAYYVRDRDWVPEGDERFRPDYELTLQDKEGTFAWEPVYNTLTGFSDAYDKFVERIRVRKQLMQKQAVS